jgi:1,4-alpha-glucan branching enzyme
MPLLRRNRMPFYAATGESGDACFRLWAPAARTVELIIGPQADGG